MEPGRNTHTHVQNIGPEATPEQHQLWERVRLYLHTTIPLAALLRTPWRCLRQFHHPAKTQPVARVTDPFTPCIQDRHD